MRARILALLLLLAGPGFAQAACDPVVGVSNWNACALDEVTGYPECWGSDIFSLTSTAPDVAMTALDGGDANMCGVETDGSINCWGSNGRRIVSEVPAGTTFVYATPASSTACALKSDNSVDCWGEDEQPCATNADCYVCNGGSNTGIGCSTNGDCPSSTCTTSNTCVAGDCPALSLGANWTDTASSFLLIRGDQDTYCGVTTDHSLECFGYDSGDGVFTEPSGTNFDHVDATQDHACAIKTDDSVDCWGDNTDGESTDPAGTFTDLAVVLDTSCGVKTDGSLSCWGSDAVGLLTDKPASGTYAKISGSGSTMCAVTTAGNVVCWGDDSNSIVTGSAGSECTAVAAATGYVSLCVGM